MPKLETATTLDAAVFDIDKEARARRVALYGPISDIVWAACRQHWIIDIGWLRKQTPGLKIP